MLYKQRVVSDIAKDAGLPLPVPQYNIQPNSRITGVKQSDKGVKLDIQSTLIFNDPNENSQQPQTKEYDAVFLGTGYERPPSQLQFLSTLEDYLPNLKKTLNLTQFKNNQKVPPLVEREYYIKPSDEKIFKPRIFCLGQNEQSHGLSDSLLSVGAVRAGEVASALA